MDPIKMAEEYSSNMIKTLIQADTDAPEDVKLPVEVLNHWVEGIRSYAYVTVEEYLKGNRGGYEFTEEEVLDLWRQASDSYTQLVLNGLVDKGLVQVSVSDDGYLLYGLTEDGQEYVKNIDSE